jgi:hypothetical protein
MFRLTIRFIVAVVTFVVGVAFATLWLVPRFRPTPLVEVPQIAQISPSPAAPESSEPAPTPDSPVRAIDFANFTYPRTADLRNPGDPKTFKLKDGEFAETKNEVGMYLADVSYGDVTGDGGEEAMVRLGIHTGGSSMPNCIYIYTLRNNRPRLLWAFVTGDRADGGLRSIYAEDGRLVIELYGKEARIGGELYGTEDAPACCAKSVTRTRYEWRGNRFRQVGESEVFPNPAGHSSPVR